MNSSFNLAISDLRVWVHLGCREEEKFHPQLVSIDIELDFANIPDALINDKLEDTVCYSEVTQVIQALCKDKRFNLVEHLTYEVHQVISKMLRDKVSIVSSIKVSLCKVSPPVPGIHGGVYSVYCASPAS